MTHTHNKTIRFGIDAFILLDRLTEFSEHGLTAEKDFSNAPSYLALESMAQAGGLHFRKCMDFSRHAFLLSIQEVPLPETETISGTAVITVTQTAITETTAAYDITLTCDDMTLHGSFMFGSAPFGEQFSQDALATHYRELFEWLQNA